MNFKDKLFSIRRESGLSQEELADKLEVSRQAVSKWETGQVMPEISKMVQISELFNVSLDYLLKDSVIEKSSNTRTNSDTEKLINKLDKIANVISDRVVYEYKSKKKIFGIPLVHILLTHGSKLVPAKGIIAIGNAAIGVVSIGALSLGCISFGAISVGLLAVGAIAFGLISVGAITIGLLSIGAIVSCVYGMGAIVLASKAGVGSVVVADVAAGVKADGQITMLLTEDTTREQVRSFLTSNCPDIPRFILKLLTLTCKN